MRPSPEPWRACIQVFQPQTVSATTSNSLRHSAICYSVVRWHLPATSSFVRRGRTKLPDGRHAPQEGDGRRPRVCVETRESQRCRCLLCFSSLADVFQRELGLPHSVPQPNGQSTHHRNQGNLFLLRILRHQSFIHFSCVRVMTHVSPGRLTQHPA